MSAATNNEYNKNYSVIYIHLNAYCVSPALLPATSGLHLTLLCAEADKSRPVACQQLLAIFEASLLTRVFLEAGQEQSSGEEV